MKIFISYASQDQEAREEIADYLVDLEHEVWADRALKSGQEWWNEILEEIRKNEVFVTLISQPYSQSEACRLELEYAVALNKHILPIKIEAVSNQLLPYELARLQMMDYAALSPTKRITKLVTALKEIGATDDFPRPLPEPLPAEPAIPISYKARIYNRLESKEELDVATQKAIVGELRQAIRETSSDHSEIRQLLQKMLRRGDEIRFNTSQEIKELIQKIDAQSTGGASDTNKHGKQGDRPEERRAPDDTKEREDASQEEKLSTGLQFLAFVFPVAGVVMYFMYKGNAQPKAKRALLLAIAGAITYVVLQAASYDPELAYYGGYSY